MPEEEYTIPLGVADIKRSGEDITIVATSSMVYVALEAAQMLVESGIGAMNVPIPFSPALEDLTIPNAKVVCETAKSLCGKN